jgi:hypothetical protein
MKKAPTGPYLVSGGWTGRGRQILVVFERVWIRALSNPGAPLQALLPVERPANHHVARGRKSNRRKEDGAEHLYAAAVWR